jgi:hypothetical protein
MEKDGKICWIHLAQITWAPTGFSKKILLHKLIKIKTTYRNHETTTNSRYGIIYRMNTEKIGTNVLTGWAPTRLRKPILKYQPKEKVVVRLLKWERDCFLISITGFNMPNARKDDHYNGHCTYKSLAHTMQIMDIYGISMSSKYTNQFIFTCTEPVRKYRRECFSTVNGHSLNK